MGQDQKSKDNRMMLHFAVCSFCWMVFFIYHQWTDGREFGPLEVLVLLVGGMVLGVAISLIPVALFNAAKIVLGRDSD